MPNHFFSQNGLTACCTDTSITLFWDKPAAAGAVETIGGDMAGGTVEAVGCQGQAAGGEGGYEQGGEDLLFHAVWLRVGAES